MLGKASIRVAHRARQTRWLRHEVPLRLAKRADTMQEGCVDWCGGLEHEKVADVMLGYDAASRDT